MISAATTNQSTDHAAPVWYRIEQETRPRDDKPMYIVMTFSLLIGTTKSSTNLLWAWAVFIYVDRVDSLDCDLDLG